MCTRKKKHLCPGDHFSDIFHQVRLDVELSRPPHASIEDQYCLLLDTMWTHKHGKTPATKMTCLHWSSDLNFGGGRWWGRAFFFHLSNRERKTRCVNQRVEPRITMRQTNRQRNCLSLIRFKLLVSQASPLIYLVSLNVGKLFFIIGALREIPQKEPNGWSWLRSLRRKVNWTGNFPDLFERMSHKIQHIILTGVRRCQPDDRPRIQMSAHCHLQLHSVGWLDSCWLESCWKVYQGLNSGQTSTYTVSHHGAFHARCNKYNFPIRDKTVLYFSICQLAPKTPVRLLPPHTHTHAHPSRTNPPENTSVVWGKLIWVSQFLRLVLTLRLTSHSFHSLLPKQTRIYWNDFSASKLVSIVTLCEFVFFGFVFFFLKKKRSFKLCCQSRRGN